MLVALTTALVTGTTFILATPPTREKILCSAMDGAKTGAVVAKYLITGFSPVIVALALKKNEGEFVPSLCQAVGMTAITVLESALIGFVGGLLRGSIKSYFSA
jgi:hypothetical protein